MRQVVAVGEVGALRAEGAEVMLFRWHYHVFVEWSTKGPNDRWLSFRRFTGEPARLDICIPDVAFYVLIVGALAASL